MWGRWVTEITEEPSRDRSHFISRKPLAVWTVTAFGDERKLCVREARAQRIELARFRSRIFCAVHDERGHAQPRQLAGVQISVRRRALVGDPTPGGAVHPDHLAPAVAVIAREHRAHSL